MASNKLDVNKICRTCMFEGANMRSLFYKLGDERCVHDLLEFITNININSDDSLPKQVCDKCERFLLTAAYFKQRCLDVESKLKKLFNNESTSISVIKNEDNEKGIGIDSDEPYQCSICFSKYSEIALLEDHVDNFHRVRKIPLYNELELFSNGKADLTLETISEMDENEVIKEEFNDTIDQDSQLNDNDYSEHDAESVLIQFPPENKDMLNKMTIDLNNKAIDKLLIKEHECVKCNQLFKSANSLNIHKRKHNERKEVEKKYQCSLCMRKFISKSGLTNHLRIHESKDDVKYTCGSCKREFKYKSHLDNHMITLHANEKGFSCDYCPKNFATQESLEIHKDLHKIDKKHSCQFCNKAFYMLSTLTDHIRTHTGEKPYLCSTCGRGFSQKTNLAQHMRRHLGLKPFSCEICTQSQKTNLALHMRRHLGLKPFGCDICNRRFVSKGELVAHTRKHSGAHPFICDECGNGFTTSSSLVKHRRTHSGERPYACDLCHMRFAASGTLKNHRRTHTGEKPYQCSHCEKAFVQKNDLVSHVRCHTGERPFVCNACGSAFRKPAALRSHAKLHAGDKDLVPY